MGEQGIYLLGLAHPLVAVVLPLLYIECWFSSLSSWSTCHFVPLPAAPPKRHGLGEALQKYFLHHHHYIEVLLDFLVDPLLPLPRWNEGSEVVVKPHV